MKNLSEIAKRRNVASFMIRNYDGEEYYTNPIAGGSIRIIEEEIEGSWVFYMVEFNPSGEEIKRTRLSYVVEWDWE